MRTSVRKLLYSNDYVCRNYLMLSVYGLCAIEISNGKYAGQ